MRVLVEAEESILGQMKSDFEGYGIELEVTRRAETKQTHEPQRDNSGYPYPYYYYRPCGAARR